MDAEGFSIDSEWTSNGPGKDVQWKFHPALIGIPPQTN